MDGIKKVNKNENSSCHNNKNEKHIIKVDFNTIPKSLKLINK